ncbi:hypothetical protein BV25DRAFT_1911278 [Artomyces pyxidatus]|uniref:Uncharacterized protein n=1 Tax=Artomyces pyxidatus TaxID=48021 RepID=A0ACB8TIP3_9AGAM|nr:hypothetical protein BV25DRAFT_1911278 [Artomyces pyxidatus]
MAPKRKSDAIELIDPALVPQDGASKRAAPPAKKARVSDAVDASSGSASSSKSKATSSSAPKTWQDVVLDGEEEDDVPIYDDCNEIRRKIRLLLKEPGFKITHWLKDIGGINNNSYQRFMKDTGPAAGASNGTYPAAYKYFEKRRILEGKKKTPKRIRNEENGGFGLRDRRHMWVFTG